MQGGFLNVLTKGNTMPFTVDTTQVTNHKEVCYKKKTKEGKLFYADATHHLAWGSMAIGIGEITKNNFTYLI